MEFFFVLNHNINNQAKKFFVFIIIIRSEAENVWFRYYNIRSKDNFSDVNFCMICNNHTGYNVIVTRVKLFEPNSM